MIITQTCPDENVSDNDRKTAARGGNMQSRPRKLAIYTFIDAFGWEVYQHYGFLNNILVHKRPLETTFGFSSAADPSILTGRYPDEHGHWSCFYYDENNSPFKWFKYLSYLPSFIFDRWRFRHLLSKVVKKLYGYTGYFELYSVPFGKLPFFDYLEKRDYFVPGGIIKTDTIFDWCVENRVPYYCSNWRHDEASILAANKAEIAKGKINMTYLYLPKLDALMHNHGTRHARVEAKIRWLEKQVLEVYELALSHYDEVSLYVISDHGMANVRGSVDVMAKVESLGLKYGVDYVAMYDSTMARFWFKHERAKALITSCLADIDDGRIMQEAELKGLRVPHDDGKFGELYFLVNPGILINPNYMGLNVIPGMHGYDPKHKDSYATILSNRALPEHVRSITDIRKTMENELRHAIGSC